MSRIFLGLALLAVGLLVANIVLGLMIGDYNGVWREQFQAVGRLRELTSQGASQDEIDALRRQIDVTGDRLHPIVERKVTHFLLGLIAALVTLLVNSITVTYFIGTSRWCLEVVDTYGLDQSLVDRCNRLKRQAFPLALCGILTVLGIAVLGAFSDPAGPFLTGAADWVTPHLLAATVGTGLIAWLLWLQLARIDANYKVIEEIVEHVRRIRAERGLDND
ncbi:MAG: hypothetical protein RIC55_07125 [Pirellulaceae bacterium]